MQNIERVEVCAVTKMNKIVPGVVAAGFASLLLATGVQAQGQGQAQGAAGRISAPTETTIYRNGTPVPATEGVLVQEGDEVVTSQQGGTTIVYPDGCSYVVGRGRRETVSAVSPCKAPVAARGNGGGSSNGLRGVTRAQAVAAGSAAVALAAVAARLADDDDEASQ